MKKFIFLFLIFAIILSFSPWLLTGPVMAGEKDKYGGVLKWNHGKTAREFGDPLGIRTWNHCFIDFVLQTLIRPSNDKLGALDPELATGWEIAPDRSHVTLKLRKGVKFHDGTDFNAQAVKWNLDRWIKSPRPKLSTVKSIDVIDNYTVRLNLSGWKATVLSDLHKETYMISPTAFEKNGQKWAKHNPVGTGPFKLISFKRNTYLKYKKFEGYWEEGLPYLDGVFVTMIPDPMTAMLSLWRGELNALIEVAIGLVDEIRKKGGFEVLAVPGNHQLIKFNSKDPNSVFSDKRMREALEYAIDKKKIARNVLRGLFSPVYEIVHSINAQSDPGTVPREYSPEKAKQLIMEAGYSKGLKIELIYISGNTRLKDTALALKKYLKDVGIELEITPVTHAVSNTYQFQPLPPNFLTLIGQRGSAGDILASTDETLHRDSIWLKGVNRPGGFDEILEKALLAVDYKEQLNYLSKMEKLAYEFAMFTPLWTEPKLVAHSHKVKDADWFWAGVLYPYLRRTWLSK